MTEKKLSDLKKEFLSTMDAVLAIDEFKRLANSQDYEREIKPDLKHNVHLTFVMHAQIDFDVSVDVEIGHMQIQRLKFGWRPDMTPRKIKETATYGYELGQLTGGYPLRWKINFTTDLKSVCEDIYTTVKRIGYPFLHKYSDLRTILTELYSEKPRDWKTDRQTRAELIPIIEMVLGEKKKGMESFKKFYFELKKQDSEFYDKHYLPLVRYVASQMNMPSPV